MIERPELVATPATVPELATMIDIVVPVHNEEADLGASIRSAAPSASSSPAATT
jgi:hypothetical protein